MEKERIRSVEGVRCMWRVGRRTAMEPPWLTRVEVPHILVVIVVVVVVADIGESREVVCGAVR